MLKDKWEEHSLKPLCTEVAIKLSLYLSGVEESNLDKRLVNESIRYIEVDKD